MTGIRVAEPYTPIVPTLVRDTVVPEILTPFVPMKFIFHTTPFTEDTGAAGLRSSIQSHILHGVLVDNIYDLLSPLAIQTSHRTAVAYVVHPDCVVAVQTVLIVIPGRLISDTFPLASSPAIPFGIFFSAFSALVNRDGVQ